MLVNEHGVEMLKDLLATHEWSQYSAGILQLAQSIISRCERFAVDSDSVTDDERESDGMND